MFDLVFTDSLVYHYVHQERGGRTAGVDRAKGRDREKQREMESKEPDLA